MYIKKASLKTLNRLETAFNKFLAKQIEAYFHFEKYQLFVKVESRT